MFALSIEFTSELVVLVTWMMLRARVGNSGYEMKRRIAWCLFWGFSSCHLVDPRMHKSSVCPFTDDGEPYVTNLLAFKFMIEESHCQGFGLLAYHPANL